MATKNRPPLLSEVNCADITEFLQKASSRGEGLRLTVTKFGGVEIQKETVIIRKAPVSGLYVYHMKGELFISHGTKDYRPLAMNDFILWCAHANEIANRGGSHYGQPDHIGFDRT